ncbi:ABC transporter substrate-binding protein [Leucobacter chironomi]|uniref:ABC transporter substrate-binding protein n=1 Tax=Leucobacter chironomi TaxID=491918 RepID=UPI000405F353|nr:ABC transporter substrate-binding protein [Leucobacter chironomi]
MKFTNGLRTLTTMGAVAALAIGLAGCSGMSDTGSGGQSKPANENCESVDKVTVVLQWLTQAQFAGYFAADDKGYYADQCLEVTIQEGGTNVVPNQVVASGNAEFGVSLLPRSLASREEGADIKLISQIYQNNSYLQVAWADSGFTELADLKGTTLGAWGGGNDLTLRAALAGSGINMDTDVNVVQQPFDMSLLLNREADSVQALTINEYAQLLETVNPETGELYTEDDFTMFNLQELGYNTLADGVYAQGAWLEDEANQDIAARFLAASYEGWAFCRDNAQECVDIVLQRGSALGATHQLWMMNEVNKLIWTDNGTPIGTVNPEDFERTVEIAIDGGTLKNPASESDVVDSSAHDAALKLLADTDVDVIGAGFKPIKVTLTEGGK